ncbi:MAG: cytochrome c [Candidatus Acidiferrales bacterium]
MRSFGFGGAILMVMASVSLAAGSGRAHGKAADVTPQSAPNAREQTYIGREDQIRAGEKLFRQHCAECHGADGHGIGKAANLQSPHVQAKSPAELVEFLRNGNLWKGMPSWAGLPEERRWQIVAYIKTLRAQ